MKIQWENLEKGHSNDGGFATSRLKVFGGWSLMHSCWDNNNNTQSESMVFIPDPNHEWSIDE